MTGLQAANSAHALRGPGGGPPDEPGSFSHHAAAHGFLDSPINLLVAAGSLSVGGSPSACPLLLLSCSIILLEIGVKQHAASATFRCLRRGEAEVHPTAGSIPNCVVPTSFCASTLTRLQSSASPTRLYQRPWLSHLANPGMKDRAGLEKSIRKR